MQLDGLRRHQYGMPGGLVYAACTNEHCQALVARLQHQVHNLREEKSQLESLIFMQQQTIHQIDRVGFTEFLYSRRCSRKVIAVSVVEGAQGKFSLHAMSRNLQDGRTTEEGAKRQLEVQQRLATVLQDEKARLSSLQQDPHYTVNKS